MRTTLDGLHGHDAMPEFGVYASMFRDHCGCDDNRNAGERSRLCCRQGDTTRSPSERGPYPGRSRVAQDRHPPRVPPGMRAPPAASSQGGERYLHRPSPTTMTESAPPPQLGSVVKAPCPARCLADKPGAISPEIAKKFRSRGTRTPRYRNGAQ
jgi:hypothetical protein